MSFKDDAEATWVALVESLLAHGFEVDADGTPFGEVQFAVGPDDRRFAQIEVGRSDGFPFRPPRVRPWDGSGTRSWHQERDGTLCLYGNDGNSDWPWLDASALIARVANWFNLDAT